MCVIAVCNNGAKLDKKIFHSCFEANDDGVGMAWVDGAFIGYAKGYMKKRSAWEMYRQIKDFPHVVHFRLSSAGGVCKELTHPFLVTKDSPISMYGLGKDSLLFHNGTISDWKSNLFSIAIANGKLPEGQMSDTRFAAMAISILGNNYLKLLGGKFVVVDKEGFHMIGDFQKDDDVWYSNLYWKNRGKVYCGYSSDDVFPRYTWERDEKGMWTKRADGIIVKNTDVIQKKQMELPVELRGSGVVRSCLTCIFERKDENYQSRCSKRGKLKDNTPCSEWKGMKEEEGKDDLKKHNYSIRRSCTNCLFEYSDASGEKKCSKHGNLKDDIACGQWEHDKQEVSKSAEHVGNSNDILDESSQDEIVRDGKTQAELDAEAEMELIYNNMLM